MPKKTYRLVTEEVEQLEKKIRSYRKKVVIVIFFLVTLALVGAGSLYIVYETPGPSTWNLAEIY